MRSGREVQVTNMPPPKSNMPSLRPPSPAQNAASRASFTIEDASIMHLCPASMRIMQFSIQDPEADLSGTLL